MFFRKKNVFYFTKNFCLNCSQITGEVLAVEMIKAFMMHTEITNPKEFCSVIVVDAPG